MEARRVVLLIPGVRVGGTSVGTTVSPEGIHRCWEESDFFTLIEPRARTSRKHLAKNAQEKKGIEGPEPVPSEH